MSERHNHGDRLRARLHWVWLLTLAVAGCGPELSSPSEIDISGDWFTTSTIPPITDIQMHITQSPDGTLTGNWSGKSPIANPTCPPELGLNPANIVTGNNTVLEVNFELLGAGVFEGQALNGDFIQGSFASCGKSYAVTFLRSTGAPLTIDRARLLP